ncbi:hypothetical protein Vadar_015677 [Vaccinium darrowii]|uniref:Uncharacterized protein n=1 Tax=Vaccinium darrowii TaxID=229202 RepID=A0ACB7YM27_9ERIC|nr:hypothetical protein Vadar_015677 [Vaccinium darrowii]
MGSKVSVLKRTNGITQSELGKEFGMKRNNIFYVLRNLECRGLIVRQSTLVRTKETNNEGEPKNSLIVNTNMLHLYRYAKHLGCQQRIEITKEDKSMATNESMNVNTESGAGTGEGCVKEDVHVKDYLPALKAICDKLEQSDDKMTRSYTLLVHPVILSETLVIEEQLGIGLGEMLKDARVVEEFCAKVNKKEENHNRGLAYQVWTSGNFNPEASNIFGSKPENLSNENGAYNPPDGDLAYHEKSAQAIPELDLWMSKVDVEADRKAHDEVIEPELAHGSPSNKLLMVSAAAVSNVATVETSPLDLSTPARQRSYPRLVTLLSQSVGAAVSPEVLGEIYEKLRFFDLEIRAPCSSRLNKGLPVPVLDDGSLKATAHLWGYISGSPGWDDVLSSGKDGYDLKNPHSTCKLFALDPAIKAMPVGLFLQVVGSAQKLEDMVEKCRRGYVPF